MKTLNNFSGNSETELKYSEMKSVRGGTGGVLRDEDILIPDPVPGEKDS